MIRVSVTEPRWDLSEAERRRVDQARTGTLGARGAARLLLTSPRLVRQLIPESVRLLRTASRETVWGDNAVVWLVQSERARRAVPDAALGAGWSDFATLVDMVRRYVGRDALALEVGCGSGRVSIHVAPLAAELTCTDLSRAMVEEARRNLASLPNVRCAVTDGFTLREFEDDAFDLVFAAGVLTYLAPNPLLAMLDEIARVLRPGGVCISNYGLIDDPGTVEQRLEAVRRAARSRRFNGSVEHAYIQSQITALHEVAGLHVVEACAGEDGGRVIIVGRT